MGAGTSPVGPAPADREAEGPDPVEGNGAAAAGSAGAKPAAGSTVSERPGSTSAGSAGSTSAGSAGSTVSEAAGPAPAPRRSRRFPLFTRDTARPEGGGRAASGDAPAPARQWPLLTVLCTAGVGLLIVALDPFDQAFRIGTILIGAALIAGAVLRWVVPSVGMLAVRSRFTDLVTYGLMGTLIVLLALVAQPKPWLDVPIVEDAVRFTIR
ncbi:DUF3017 domain-containing protein [Streptomyces sp. NPDC059452]|uniref:DUF3017 domain-containing protein n=1 Tax=Streptomyces sp. NPDC059452 TaxID=3346835 RepID=UPI0036D1D47E